MQINGLFLFRWIVARLNTKFFFGYYKINLNPKLRVLRTIAIYRILSLQPTNNTHLMIDVRMVPDHPRRQANPRTLPGQL